MNAPNENHEPTAIDHLHDHLLDVALAELIGGAAPNDLSAQIAAATSRQPAAITQSPRTRRNRAFWASLAVAAMLLVGVAFTLLPPTRSTREKSSMVAELTTHLQNTHDSGQPFPTASTDRLGAVAKPASNSTKTFDFDSAADLAESRAAAGRYAAVPTTAAKTSGNEYVELYMGPGGQAGATAQGPGRPAAPGHKSERYYQSAGDDVWAGYRWVRQSDSDKSGPRPEAPAEAEKSYRGRLFVNDPPGLKAKESTEGASFAFRDATPEGVGPDSSGDKYTQIVENPFIKAEGGDAVSTFSIDVDTASYSNVRQFLLDMHRLPPPDAVRIEELVNYFHYDYAPPKASDEAPFAAHVELAGCPWSPEHRLARVAVKGREMDRTKRPLSNLVFLVDVSGSMNEPAKLPLVVYGLEQLTHELGENDHIAIVVYAGTEGLVLPSTSGSKQDTILAALRNLQAGGSTAGGAGIQLAYQIAEDNFIKGGTNRVILCTDGDFNVGVTNTADLQRMVEQKAKDTGVFLSTLGFGRGNLNDAMMVAISDHGNGNYHYIDNRTEARRVLVEQMTGTLVTIAKDVKIQVEFNPAKVAGYRLIGYEKRMLRTEDFNNDKKDAGEIGAGHTVTALYEIVPVDKKVDVTAVDELKYQKPATNADGAKKVPENVSNELLTLKMRYKAPDGDTSKKLEWPITDDGKSFSAASADMKFASAVAGFCMMLRNSEYKGNLTYAATLELAQGGIGDDPHGYRKEFLEMVRTAKELRHE